MSGKIKDSLHEMDDSLESKAGEIAAGYAGSKLAASPAWNRAVDNWVKDVFLRTSDGATRMSAAGLGRIAKIMPGAGVGVAIYEMLESKPTNSDEEQWLRWYKSLSEKQRDEMVGYARETVAPHDIFYAESVGAERRRQRERDRSEMMGSRQ